MDTTDAGRLQEEYSGGIGYAYRWLLYEYSDDKIKFHEEVLRQLGLTGLESVLDVGCGQGAFLRSIREQRHQGCLVGVDVNSSIGLVSPDEGSLDLVRADASRPLPFKQGSFDVMSALFMMYHVEKPRAAIQEMSQLLKPEGKLAIATTGPDNKTEHRKFEAQIAEFLNVTAPKIYSKDFDTEVADGVLPELFRTIQTWEQRTTIEIKAGDFPEAPRRINGVVSAYMGSMRSMAWHYDPVIAASDMKQPFEELVLPQIKQRIAEEGKFSEPVHRKLYICSDPIN